MKSVFDTIWSVLIAIGEARRAACLARQGRTADAQAVYKN